MPVLGPPIWLTQPPGKILDAQRSQCTFLKTHTKNMSQKMPSHPTFNYCLLQTASREKAKLNLIEANLKNDNEKPKLFQLSSTPRALIIFLYS